MNSKQQNAILKRLENIESMLSPGEDLTEYISEREAKELLNRKTTWFWNQRRAGLPYFKLGGEVYYKRTDLAELLKPKVS